MHAHDEVHADLYRDLYAVAQRDGASKPPALLAGEEHRRAAGTTRQGKIGLADGMQQLLRAAFNALGPARSIALLPLNHRASATQAPTRLDVSIDSVLDEKAELKSRFTPSFLAPSSPSQSLQSACMRTKEDFRALDGIPSSNLGIQRFRRHCFAQLASSWASSEMGTISYRAPATLAPLRMGETAGPTCK